MFEIGGSLAAAREGRQLTLSDAERLTCLRERHLLALEQEQYELLPGRAYARAFLRTYATALGLDPDRFADEFDERYPEPVEEPAAAVLPLRRRLRPHPGLLVGLAVAAAVGGVVAWSSLSPPARVAPAPKAASAGAIPTPVVHRRAAVRPAHAAAPGPAPLVIRATRGRCWLLVRRGSTNGPVMFEGTLDQGKTVRFSARVWVRFGAPWNVTARRGARVVRGLASRVPVNLVA